MDGQEVEFSQGWQGLLTVTGEKGSAGIDS